MKPRRNTLDTFHVGWEVYRRVEVMDGCNVGKRRGGDANKTSARDKNAGGMDAGGYHYKQEGIKENNSHGRLQYWLKSCLGRRFKKFIGILI